MITSTDLSLSIFIRFPISSLLKIFPGELTILSKIINLEKERSIDVIITRLRKKIEKDSKNPRYLQTKRGEGYVLWIE